MTLIIVIIFSFLLPICSIAAFIIGYNINASKKIFAPKPKPTAEQLDRDEFLKRIDEAKVY